MISYHLKYHGVSFEFIQLQNVGIKCVPFSSVRERLRDITEGDYDGKKTKPFNSMSSFLLEQVLGLP